MSLSSNASDLIKILNSGPDQKKELVPFEDYLSIINDTMARYATEKNGLPIPQELATEENENDSKDEQIKIQKVYDDNHSILNQGSTEESMMKVIVRDFEFKNPFQSLKVLRRNKKIYDDVSQTFLERQQQLFDKTQEKIKSYSMKYKVKMPRIIIFPILAKQTVEIPKNKLEEKAPGQSIEETMGELSTERLKSNKRLSRGREKLSLPMIPIDSQLKLFAYFRYSNKNFPEAREQFSFNSNQAEIVLVGGIGSNLKNNFVWTLNPGKHLNYVIFFIA
jgi:hypothetical protein